MKIVAYVGARVEMEIDNKFSKLLKEDNAVLQKELAKTILASDSRFYDVCGIWDEPEENCICEY